MTPFASPEVAAKFAGYPPEARRRLLALRELVFRTAAETPGAGDIAESLKWGEPAYATKNRNGSPLRIDWKPKSPAQYVMYFQCQTSLVGTFRTLFPHDFGFEGNRALVFALQAKPPRDALQLCIAAALTYHVNKRTSATTRP